MRFLGFLSFILATSLYAEGGVEYLTKEKKQTLEIEKKINDKSATSLKYDWIEPIVASYTYSKSNQIGKTSTSKYFRVSFNQPVFKSGGIYFAIQYSKANKAFKDIAFELKKVGLIKSLYQSVLSLKKLDLEIEKANLSIENATIDIERKKEQFDSGLLDSSFLDAAILKRSQLEHQVLNLKSLKFQSLESFKNISDVSYESIKLPYLESVSQEEFVSNNLDIATAKEQKQQQRYLKNMTISNYLPTVSLFGDYNHKDDEIQFFKQAKEYKNYGARVSMPLFAVNRGRDIEIRKLEYLKAKIALKEQKKATQREFKSLEHNINTLAKRIEIAKNDVTLYAGLVTNAQEGVLAGEKTQSDLKTLKNSQSIASVDAKIYDIDRELEILKLYAKMNNEI